MSQQEKLQQLKLSGQWKLPQAAINLHHQMVHHSFCRKCSKDMCLKTLQRAEQKCLSWVSDGLGPYLPRYMYFLVRGWIRHSVWWVEKFHNSKATRSVTYSPTIGEKRKIKSLLDSCRHCSLVMPRAVMWQRKLWTLFGSQAINYPSGSDKFVIRSTKCEQHYRSFDQQRLIWYDLFTRED